MHDRINELMDKIASQAKSKAGELLENGRLEREEKLAARRQVNRTEPMSHQQRLDAEELDQMVQEQRDQDANVQGRRTMDEQLAQGQATTDHGQQMATQD